MNGNRSSAYSGVFLALGSLVVAAAGFRALVGFMRVRGAVASAARAAGSPVIVAAVLLIFVVVAVSVGAIQRRPWALGASVVLLGIGAAAGMGTAIFQLSAMLRGIDRVSDGLEAGYGPVLSHWRIGSVIVGLLVTVFCAAAVRRLSSEEMRREFRG
ncbi:MAG TPA: hypothetical protein VE007_08960 [Thermoanaerobaculia bacterium]|nr:hypothetical protein [Thermoanaerobaculia bacterium]